MPAPQRIIYSLHDAFLTGMASVLNPCAVMELQLPMAPTDEDAVRDDWEAVGDDIRTALGESARTI
jgi:hypothetical protein